MNMSSKKGEIATALILLGMGVMLVAGFVTSQFTASNKKVKTTAQASGAGTVPPGGQCSLASDCEPQAGKCMTCNAFKCVEQFPCANPAPNGGTIQNGGGTSAGSGNPNNGTIQNGGGTSAGSGNPNGGTIQTGGGTNPSSCVIDGNSPGTSDSDGAKCCSHNFYNYCPHQANCRIQCGLPPTPTTPVSGNTQPSSCILDGQSTNSTDPNTSLQCCSKTFHQQCAGPACVVICGGAIAAPTLTPTVTPIPTVTPAMPPACVTLKQSIEAAYGSSCGTSNYDRKADLSGNGGDGDGKVDVFDMTVFSSHAYDNNWCQAKNAVTGLPRICITPTPTLPPVSGGTQPSSCILDGQSTNSVDPNTSLLCCSKTFHQECGGAACVVICGGRNAAPTLTPTATPIPTATPTIPPDCQTLGNIINSAFNGNCLNGKYNPVADLDNDTLVADKDWKMWLAHQYDNAWCSQEMNRQVTDKCALSEPTPTPGFPGCLKDGNEAGSALNDTQKCCSGKYTYMIAGVRAIYVCGGTSVVPSPTPSCEQAHAGIAALNSLDFNNDGVLTVQDYIYAVRNFAKIVPAKNSFLKIDALEVSRLIANLGTNLGFAAQTLPPCPTSTPR